MMHMLLCGLLWVLGIAVGVVIFIGVIGLVVIALIKASKTPWSTHFKRIKAMGWPSKWAIIIPAMFFLLVVAILMTGVQNYVFTDAFMALGIGVIILALILTGLRKELKGEEKEKLIAKICIWVVVITLVAIGYHRFGASASSYLADFPLPSLPGQSSSSEPKVGEKWDVEKVINVPVGRINAVRFEIPWLACQVKVQGLGPNPNGEYKIFSPGWDKAWESGATEHPLPALTSQKFEVWSDKEPVNIKVCWR